MEADPEELAVLKAYTSGDPEYQPLLSGDTVIKELGI